MAACEKWQPYAVDKGSSDGMKVNILHFWKLNWLEVGKELRLLPEG